MEIEPQCEFCWGLFSKYRGHDLEERQIYSDFIDSLFIETEVNYGKTAKKSKENWPGAEQAQIAETEAKPDNEQGWNFR